MIKMIFKNFIGYFLIIFFALSNISLAEIIKDIKIEGNKRVNIETIKIFGGVSIGDDINTNDLNDILKRLYETNFFEKIDIDFQNSILNVRLIENPIIQNLIIRGIKNKDIKKEVLDLISFKEKSPFLESFIDRESNKIKNYIQEGGYYFSKIDILKKENDNNTVDLILDIDLGEKAFINEIIFLGDKKFKKRKLLNVITSEEDKFWKFISSKRLLNKQRLELDKRLLLNFYKNKGYFKASVLDKTVQYDETKNFNIVFNIDSGIKYYFGNLDLELPTDFERKYFQDAIKKLNSFSGEKYSLKIIEKMLNQIEKIASSEQYEFINAQIEENIVDKNKIDIRFISNGNYFLKVIDNNNNLKTFTIIKK